MIYLESMKRVISETRISNEFSLSTPQKISKKKNCSFSLPAGSKYSCIGATKACKLCYAMHKRHCFYSVQRSLAKNWQLMKKLERYKKDKLAVKMLLQKIPKNIDLFRIHSSGDFHSQWAIDVWAEIIKQKKDIKFWAYTRSFNLNFTKLTRNKNFSLWASTDDFNYAEAKKFVRQYRKSGTKHAYGPWQHDQKIPSKSVICPATNGKINILGACEKCMLCVIKKRINKNIVFLAH